jgi:hypothetical protein
VNERIKQLAEQVVGPSRLHGGDFALMGNEQVEKFAELIVRECISSVGSQADKAYLRKHFGLPVESDIVYPAAEESWSVKSQYNREYNFPK